MAGLIQNYLKCREAVRRPKIQYRKSKSQLKILKEGSELMMNMKCLANYTLNLGLPHKGNLAAIK
jgi:hypothetical protein